MPTYEYRCGNCGIVEKPHRMGSARQVEPCPGCGEPARRVFSTPLLRRVSAPAAAALERAERSRHEPDVVTRGGPGAASHANERTVHPALQRLVGKENATRLRGGTHPGDPG